MFNHAAWLHEAWHELRLGRPFQILTCQFMMLSTSYWFSQLRLSSSMMAAASSQVKTFASSCDPA